MGPVQIGAVRGVRMSVQLNHTIVSVRDKRESATFLAEILGVGEPTTYGPFLIVQVDNEVSLDFADDHGPVYPQHYAFLVSKADFDEIFGRIRDRGLPYWADPGRQRPGEYNTNDGGHGVDRSAAAGAPIVRPVAHVEPDAGVGAGVLPAGVAQPDRHPGGGTGGLRRDAAARPGPPLGREDRLRGRAVRIPGAVVDRCVQAMAVDLLADPGRLHVWSGARAGGRPAADRDPAGERSDLVRRPARCHRPGPVRDCAGHACRLPARWRLGIQLSRSGPRRPEPTGVCCTPPDTTAGLRCRPPRHYGGRSPSALAEPVRRDRLDRCGRQAAWARARIGAGAAGGGRCNSTTPVDPTPRARWTGGSGRRVVVRAVGGCQRGEVSQGSGRSMKVGWPSCKAISSSMSSFNCAGGSCRSPSRAAFSEVKYTALV